MSNAQFDQVGYDYWNSHFHAHSHKIFRSSWNKILVMPLSCSDDLQVATRGNWDFSRYLTWKAYFDYTTFKSRSGSRSKFHVESRSRWSAFSGLKLPFHFLQLILYSIFQRSQHHDRKRRSQRKIRCRWLCEGGTFATMNATPTINARFPVSVATVTATAAWRDFVFNC